jgi:hypothetical protein
MNNQKRRAFRPRQNKNGFRRRNSNTSSNNNGHFQNNNGNSVFVRNGSMTNPFSVEKTIQKYQQLAKDAQSAGDPVLVENYLQHADHYSRRLSELNIKNKPEIVVKESDEKTSEAPLPKSEQTSLSQKTPTEEKV